MFLEFKQNRDSYVKENTSLPDRVDMNKVNDFVASVNAKICLGKKESATYDQKRSNEFYCA